MKKRRKKKGKMPAGLKKYFAAKKRNSSPKKRRKKKARSIVTHVFHHHKKKRKAGRKMARRKHGKKHHSRRGATSSQAGFLSGSMLQILIKAGIVAASVVGSNLAVAKIPFLNKISSGWRAILLTAAGSGGVFYFRNKWFKLVSGGVMMGGLLRGVDSVTGHKMLAGPGRRLTASEFAALTQNMGLPSNVRFGMGVPASVSQRRLGIPSSVQMGYSPAMASSSQGGWSGGW